MRYFPLLLLGFQHLATALYLTVHGIDQSQITGSQTTRFATTTVDDALRTTITPMATTLLLPVSATITLPPISQNRLEVRQRCFNDQGFSVNCATWTGYYYTWGPPGDPYEGGPGEGGGSSETGNGVTTIVSEGLRVSPTGIITSALFSLLMLVAIL